LCHAKVVSFAACVIVDAECNWASQTGFPQVQFSHLRLPKGVIDKPNGTYQEARESCLKGPWNESAMDQSSSVS